MLSLSALPLKVKRLIDIVLQAEGLGKIFLQAFYRMANKHSFINVILCIIPLLIKL